jgi:uroporphyrinogen-III synthase
VKVETVVLTASAGSFAGLGTKLDRERFTVEEHPLISFGPPESWIPLDSALTELASFGSVAFTSPRAARAVAERARDLGVSWPRGTKPGIWAVGAGTRAALGDLGTGVRVPEGNANGDPGSAAVLARAMVTSAAAAPVLFPCGENRRDELPKILRDHGLDVREVVCYRSVLASAFQAGKALARGRVVVVASPSVMQLLAAASHPAQRPRLVAVGPTTAASARALGWLPAAVAQEPSTEGVAAAIKSLLIQS